MAYLRSEVKGGEMYLRICKSVREEGRVVQKTLYSLGKRSSYSDESLRLIGQKLYVLGGGNLEDLFSEISEELGRYNYGFPLIMNHIYKSYDLGTFFRRLQKSQKTSFDLGHVVSLMLCNRLSEPLSKLGLHEVRGDFWGYEGVKLHWLYRSLDKLSNCSEALQYHLYQKNIQLFDYEVDVVFYDVTTFYFDSEEEQEGSLRQKGFGKDGKVGKTQLLLGLLLDKHRNPIAYELYNGDKYEGHTLKDAVKKLRQKYRLKKVVVVADSGMLNSDNLSSVSENGYEFIVGERLKNLPQSIQNELLKLDKYEKMVISGVAENEKGIEVSYRIVEHNGRKILCTYSEKRAKKDRFEREKRIEKGKALAKNPASLAKKAARYYLKSATVDKETGEIIASQGDKTHLNFYEIDSQKVENAAKYDGLKAIATSDRTLSNQDILLKYRDLYQIEQTFRTFKSFLETRPMFHWTDSRIKGHFCLCYLAFSCLNYLQQSLQKKHIFYSENTIRKILNQMQFSHIKQGNQAYFLNAKLEKQSVELLNAFGLSQLPNVATNDLIINYLNKM